MINYEKVNTGTLLAFALCLDDPAAIDSQQKLLQHLVHTILFNNKDGQLNINAIQTKLVDTFGATDIFPVHKIEGTIKDSIQDGTVEALSNKEYRLSQKRVDLIDAAQEKHNLSRDSFHQNIIQNIDK